MNESQFWDLIDKARGVANQTADIPGILEACLSGMTVEEIVAYEVTLRRLMDTAYDRFLWLAAAVISGACGEDGFAYFRGWLVAQGRDVFESALANPDSLAGLSSFAGDDALPELEKMLYVGRLAYRRKTGRDELELHLPPYKKPMLKRPEIWSGRLSSVPRLLPRLSQRCGAAGGPVEHE